MRPGQGQDYGIDLAVLTFNASGECENGHLDVQVKSTERVEPTANGQEIPVRVASADVRCWIMQPLPVVLILNEDASKTAWWIRMQDYADDGQLRSFGETTTVRIPVTSRLTESTLTEFRQFRDRLLGRVQESKE